ncbi:unnamed protein product [Rotaria sp. Silwood2]|nr:unnamed protein product [Rotaria sp. Silwood2]
MLPLFIIIFMAHPIYGSYHYVGCYTQAFHDSYFISSYMEPNLCFHLCNTPIIYLQRVICRCSGGGLMHHNRLKDQLCKIPCMRWSNSQGKTTDTCGGIRPYSAYAEDKFYTQHGHLFNYQIQFSSCELWTNSGYYDTLKVIFNKTSIKSPLNKMEQCAAACLDETTITKSIAFNNDNNQCVCIISRQDYLPFPSSHYLTILSNSSCNHYCDNILDDSKVEHKFQCGSLTDSRTWAIYDLNGSCPFDYVYIKELKKCIYAYKAFWSSCASPSISYVYDRNITWNIFLKIIEKLNLKQSIVSIDFDSDITIDSSWKCSLTINDKSYSNSSQISYSSWSSTTRYVLDNGCLRTRSYILYSHRFLYRLCITNPINKYSISYDDGNEMPYMSSLFPEIRFCPMNWFDLNGRCYRISDERKTIQDARNNCITTSTSESSKNDKSHFWFIHDDDDDDDNDKDDSFKSEIVQYTSQWQARLGFFLLDKLPDSDETNNKTTTQSSSLYSKNVTSSVSNVSMYRSPINEFQMINPSEKKNLSEIDYSCIIAIRASIEEKGNPILNTTQINNCLKPKHVLCETKTLLVHNFQQRCFSKPITLDLPAFISKYLTYELCLSICQGLQTTLAVININKCYCLNGYASKVFNFTKDRVEYLRQDCGNPCPGM